jgi:polyisoprenoid-binding protein YceI
MRNTTLFVLGILLLSSPAILSAEATTWSADTTHSEVAFSVRHFFTQVPGSFGGFEGTIVHDPDNLAGSSVEFTVDAASIDTKDPKRDEHLRSADFFDVANNPTLTFKSTGVAGAGNNLEVTGDLTIRGTTKSITIPVEFAGSMDTPMGRKAGFSTEFAIDRHEFGVSWNRALEGGGAVLGDDVKVRINIEAGTS